MNSGACKATMLVFGITLIFSNSSFAQSENRDERKRPPKFEELIKKMDADKDGKISKTEAKGPLKKAFGKIDGNEDGFITEEEFNKAPKPKRGRKK